MTHACSLLHAPSSRILHSRLSRDECQIGSMDVKRRINTIIDAREDLSVRNVALKAGLSDSALHKFLTNDDQSMTIANLEKVAFVLGTTAQALLGGNEPRPTAEVVNIWDRIPAARRQHAISILKTFAEDGDDQGAASSPV